MGVRARGREGKEVNTTASEFNLISVAMLDFGDAIKCVTDALSEMAQVIEEHREQWLCESQGQWPDKFALLNRYVRTDYAPPFIFND